MEGRFVLGLLALSCAVPSLAAEADKGFYLGVEFGQSRSDVGLGDALVGQLGTLIGTSSDKNASAYGAYFGYAVSRHFSIELSYSNLGEVWYLEEREVTLPTVPLPMPPFGGGSAVVVPERQQTVIDSESISLTLIGRFPMTETVFLTGRAGLAAHLLEADLRFWFSGNQFARISGAFDESSAAALVGVGLEWDFHSSWHARLQVQQHLMLEDEEFPNNVSRGDVTLLSAGLGYRF